MLPADTITPVNARLIYEGQTTSNRQDRSPARFPIILGGHIENINQSFFEAFSSINGAIISYTSPRFSTPRLILDASFDETNRRLYFLQTTGEVDYIEYNQNGTVASTILNHGFIHTGVTRIAASNGNVWVTNNLSTPLTAICYDSTGARDAQKDYTISETGLVGNNLGIYLYQYEISNGWEFIMRTRDTGYARKLDIQTTSVTYDADIDTETFSNVNARLSTHLSVSSGVLATMHVSSVGNNASNDNLSLITLDSRYNIVSRTPDGTTTNLTRIPSQGGTYIYMASLDTTLSRPSSIIEGETTLFELKVKRIGVEYQGPLTTYDKDGNARSVLNAEKSVFLQIQDPIPDAILEHEGLTRFEHGGLTYTMTSIEQTETSPYIMKCSYA